MWITLLLMAVAVSLEPFRVGMTVLMINRPRPALQLLAFLAGGFTMGIAVGIVVLFILRPALGSSHSTLPVVQIVVGAVLLVNAALVGTRVIGKPNADRPAWGWAQRLGPIAGRIRRLLDTRSVWAAGIVGMGIALPSVDYLAALALIVASGAAAGTQFTALILFNMVAFALVEIPLVCYLVAPDRTRATLTALYDWLRSKGPRGIAILLATIGFVLLGVGFASL